jgi:septal ring factor EnvC (AmiA/AmiB activator)
VSRKNLSILIVSSAVVLGLIVAVFIVPSIQPPAVEARAKLDEAAERAARRLNVLQRMADQAVVADRERLTLPENIFKPDAEAIQRTIATNQNLITDSLAQVSGTFKPMLAEDDKRYEEITGHKPSDGRYADAIQVPGGVSAQVSWVKQTFTRTEDASARMRKELDNAINELQQSISSIQLANYHGSDHFRAMWLLGSLQYQKALFLSNLAANRRAKAAIIRARLADEYRWYTGATAQIKGLESRLAGVSLARPAVAAARPARVTAPPSPLEAAIEAAGPAPVAPSPEGTAAAPAAGGRSEAAGLLSRVGSLLRSAAAAAPAASAPAQPAGEPAGAAARAAVTPESQMPASLPATEDPSALAAKYEQDFAEQIAATERQIADLEQVIAGPRQQLEQVQQQLKQLQDKLAALEHAGYDVTSLDSFEAYKNRYTDLTAQIRAAEATAQGLQYGTLAGAHPAPGGGEDLAQARYVGGKPQVGLRTMTARLEGLQKTLALLKAARQEMQDLRASLQQENLDEDKALEQIKARASQLFQQLSTTYGELDVQLAAASDLDDQALASCKAAIQSYNTAAQAARRQKQDAEEQLRAANPAPDKPNERLEWLSKYDSPQAAAESSLFSAYMLTAQIELQRALGVQSCVNLVAAVQAAGVQTKLADMAKTIQESLDAATAALGTSEGAQGALQHAEAYSRLVSREKFAWLGPVLRGLVFNMQAEVQTAAGQTQLAAEARAKAVEALAEATKGNENSEMLQPYTHLLASLRGGGP